MGRVWAGHGQGIGRAWTGRGAGLGQGFGRAWHGRRMDMGRTLCRSGHRLGMGSAWPNQPNPTHWPHGALLKEIIFR